MAVGAFAQPSPRTIGYVHPTSIAPNHPTLMLLREQWLKLGYVQDQSIFLRSADGDNGRLEGLVAELVRRGVSALIVVGPAAVKAAARVTTTTPIVAIDLETDPVRSGLAASLARPGGNVTGLFLDQPSMASKLIELLLEAVPTMSRILIVWDPHAGEHQLEAARTGARLKGLAVDLLQARPSDGYAGAFARIGLPPGTGILQFGSAGFIAEAPELAAAALKHRLPTISNLQVYARAGLLMTYGPDSDSYFGQAVTIADRIAKGARPGDLPIELPTRFRLAVNLKTAKGLGLTIPTALLLRADEAIE